MKNLTALSTAALLTGLSMQAQALCHRADAADTQLYPVDTELDTELVERAVAARDELRTRMLANHETMAAACN